MNVSWSNLNDFFPTETVANSNINILVMTNLMLETKTLS